MSCVRVRYYARLLCLEFLHQRPQPDVAQILVPQVLAYLGLWVFGLVETSSDDLQISFAVQGREQSAASRTVVLTKGPGCVV
jgi:hypothetical protein